MDRRQFVTVSAASGAAATLAGCGSPENQLIRFIPEEQFTPGIAIHKPGVCTLCSAGCGIEVRVMDSDVEVVKDGQLGVMQKPLAKKLEGNREHPVSKGKLCVRGQAAIQVTYHPDRVTGPLKRAGERGSGQFTPVSWEEALAELVAQLDGLAGAGNQGALRFLTRPLTGQRSVLIGEFLSRFGAPAATTFEFFGEQVLRRANEASFGFSQLPTFDLARSSYVIGFGADFLGTWNSPVAQNVAYGEMRRGRPGVRAKFVQVEPRMSQTGANADEWVPASMGTEGVLALGIAHVIMRSGSRDPGDAGRAGDLIAGWSEGLTDYAPEEVERITGVDAARIERLAREFAEYGPSVALIGGAPLAQTNGLFHALAVNALNALIGSIGAPGGVFFTPRPDGFVSGAQGTSIKDVASGILDGGAPAEVLLINDTNPVFGAPPAWRVAEALSAIPYIASFGQFIDETSNLADLILPDHSFLESWVDAAPESGSTMSVASLAPPVMRPLHQTRAMPDVLLTVGRSLGQPLEPALPGSYEEMLRAAFEALQEPDGSSASWTTSQRQGGWWSEMPAASPSPSVLDEGPRAFEEAAFDGDPRQYPFHFLPFASQAFLDGSLAHLPWLQELPDVMSSAMWSSWVEINPGTASGLGVVQGDLVELTSDHGTVRVPVFVSPAIAPNVIAMPVGQGHETFTRYASGRGANPISILAPMEEPTTGALAWAATRVRVAKVEGDGGLILYGGALREHPEHSR